LGARKDLNCEFEYSQQLDSRSRVWTVKEASLATSSNRLLVVEDSEPFRKFICSTLGKRPELQIVGEATDGLEAVQKAEELQPDIIVLDIGLPSLNGIEVARRLRKQSPGSKILFLSQETSADVVQEALGTGARGYVVKSDAGSELLQAVNTVLRGGQFVSKRFSAHDLVGEWDEQECTAVQACVRARVWQT
jgi:DNA-binding NarL/FixJ family response regulator